MDDRVWYFTAFEEPSDQAAAGPVIITEGAPGTAIDLYRLVAIRQSPLAEMGVAFVDIGAVKAICKIAEGGIAGIDDLAAAEIALQALLLHDRVYIAAPSARVAASGGLEYYLPSYQGERTPLWREIFALADPQDWQIAARKFDLSEHRGDVRPILDERSRELYNFPVAQEVAALISDLGVSYYSTNAKISSPRRADGFQKHFYHRMRISWDKAISGIPPLVCSFSPPPLISLVWDRMNNRQDLVSVLSELRDETAGARRELQEFNSIVTSSISQPEVERRIKRLTEAFDAVIPESRLSPAERNKRLLVSIFRVARPLLKLIPAIQFGKGMPVEEILSHAEGVETAILEKNAIANRTVTSKTFSGLMKHESVQSLAQLHLTPMELKAVEASMHS